MSGLSLACHWQFVMDSWGKKKKKKVLALIWGIHTLGMAFQDFDCIACFTKLLADSSSISSMTVIAVYPRNLTSSQRCIHIYVMRLHCMGNGGTAHYLLRPLWQTTYLRKAEKWKITSLSLNKAVLSNIYGTERKQGQTCTFIDMLIGEDCHRIGFGGRVPKKNQALCLEEVLITKIAPGPLQKSEGPCFTLFCACFCVREWKPVTHIHYQELQYNARPILHHASIVWQREKQTPCQE